MAPINSKSPIVEAIERAAREGKHRMLTPRMRLMEKARDAFLHEHAVDVGGGVLFWPSLAPLRRYERAAVRVELGLIPGRR